MSARRCFLLLALMLMSCWTVGAAEKPHALRAGAAASVITPRLGVSINGNMSDVKAVHVHDELHARCLVLDDGQTKLAVAVCDSCLFVREVHDEAKRLASEATGIPIENIVISATHSHSCGAAASAFQSDADADYQKFMAVRIADGIRRANNNLATARIGWASGSVPGQVFNRRWFLKPGTMPPNPFGGIDQVKMNPGVASPNLVKPAGPTDPEVPVVSVQAPDGRPVALLANYSLHYVGGVGSAHLSADYYGAFCDRVQQLIGADRLDPPFVAMMSNGTSGDINNVNWPGPASTTKLKPYEKIHAVANDVAAEVARVYKSIEYHDWVPLAAKRKELSLGVRLPTAEEIERAKGILAKAEGRPLKGVEEIYARETVLISKYPSHVPVIVQAFRIGDLGIAQIPCEVFAEIGLDIKKHSPFKSQFTIELANGYNGYLPTPAHHKLGGYETWRARSSYLEVDASPKIAATVFELLGQLKR